MCPALVSGPERAPVSVSFVKAAFAEKPALLRRWFFARVFARQAETQVHQRAKFARTRTTVSPKQRVATAAQAPARATSANRPQARLAHHRKLAKAA
jgi:hypothetical protein